MTNDSVFIVVNEFGRYSDHEKNIIGIFGDLYRAIASLGSRIGVNRYDYELSDSSSESDDDDSASTSRARRAKKKGRTIIPRGYYIEERMMNKIDNWDGTVYEHRTIYNERSGTLIKYHVLNCYYNPYYRGSLYSFYMLPTDIRNHRQMVPDKEFPRELKNKIEKIYEIFIELKICKDIIDLIMSYDTNSYLWRLAEYDMNTFSVERCATLQPAL